MTGSFFCCYGIYIGETPIVLGETPITLQITQSRKNTIMPKPKSKKTTPVAMETVPIDSEFLTKAVELLILMSPTYPGFPSLTLAEKIQKGDYNLSHHEQLFLATTLKALQSVSFDLRLNDLSALIKEVETRITNSQLTFVQEQEAKESLSF